jgi:hypothetical protein
MLTDKEQKNKARIEKQLSIPLPKYILIYGVLTSVVLIAVLFARRIVVGEREWVTDSGLLWLSIAVIIGVLMGFIKRTLLRQELDTLKLKETTEGNGR